MKRSKKYLETIKLIDKTKTYEVNEAVSILKKITTNFDETVDIAINLNLDTKKVGEQLRGAVVLPNGIGKTKKILVIAKGEQAKTALSAGADYVGDIDLIEKIEKENWFDFDCLIATPDMMASLGKIGKILGPKGLMPNPKTGTVTMDTKKAIEDVKKGRIEYKTDTFGNVHAIIGKISFLDVKLVENINYFINVILKSKPSTVKGTYIKNITISTTMSPGIKLNQNSFDN